MIKRRISKLIIIFIVSLLFQNHLNATSFFSTRGLGLKYEPISARGFAMGGVGIAIPQALDLSSLNPATLSPATLTRLTLHFGSEFVEQENRLGTGQSNYTNAFGGQFLIPIGENYSVSMGIQPLFLADFQFGTTVGTGEGQYRESIGNKGSLNKLFLAFYARPVKKISLGITYNYNTGKYEKPWQVDYTNEAYFDTNDRFNTQLRGHSFSMGLLFNPYKSWLLGLTYTTPSELVSRNSITHSFLVNYNDYSTTYAKTQQADGTINMPQSWGFGSSIILKNRWLISTDYFSEPLSQITENGRSLASDFNDFYRISVGLEYTSSTNPYASYFQHVPLRVGYFYKQLPGKFGNEPLHEQGFSMGFGLPFFFSMGKFDLALAYGQRGNITNNFVKENFYYLMVSVTGGERWFIRGRKR
ncbi:hypothetical protein JW964_02915 [candidate division KSB1 bacterium]|nr:hypothetical protein [candidate division KSB1 bacterium]